MGHPCRARCSWRRQERVHHLQQKPESDHIEGGDFRRVEKNPERNDYGDARARKNQHIGGEHTGNRTFDAPISGSVDLGLMMPSDSAAATPQIR